MTGHSAGLGRPPVWRSRVCAALIAAGLLLTFGASGGHAQDLQFHRIATGASGSTHYTIGGAIANAVSSPPGARACEQGGSCGVPGLVAVVQTTKGGIENVEAVNGGDAESALIEADLVYWAFRGTGLFKDREPAGRLRAIANLFASAVHVIVPSGSAILSIADLKGKRVSLGPPDSGTAATAKTVLQAYGLSPTDIEANYYPPGQASDLFEAGELDAFFVLGGLPDTVVSDLAARVSLRFLPINGTAREDLTSFYPFFKSARIDSGVYPNVGFTPTVGINTQWIISADADEALVYGLTEALWHERNRMLLEAGHAEGKEIMLESALEHIAIPLHPGAKRFYEEQGLER